MALWRKRSIKFAAKFTYNLPNVTKTKFLGGNKPHCYWEVISPPFLAKARLTDSRNSFRRLLAYLIWPWIQQIYSTDTTRRSDFHEQCHLHKLQKTFEINKAWTDTFYDDHAVPVIHPCNIYIRIRIANQFSMWIIKGSMMKRNILFELILGISPL